MIKPPIVFIHGAFCGGWAFEAFARPFAQAGYPVLTPTLRHHCADPPPALATTGVRDYAADLAGIIAGLDQPPILIGHSFGGLLAQILAAKGLARAAVLLAPSPPWGAFPTTLHELTAVHSLYALGDFWNRIITPQYDVAAVHSLDKLPRRLRDAVFARFVPESGRAMFEVLHWALDFSRATAVRAADVNCPVLCLTGAEDKINPPTTVRGIAERYRGYASFEVLAGRSHWLVGEDGWEEIAARILAWNGALLERPGEFSSARRDASPCPS